MSLFSQRQEGWMSPAEAWSKLAEDRTPMEQAELRGGNIGVAVGTLGGLAAGPGLAIYGSGLPTWARAALLFGGAPAGLLIGGAIGTGSGRVKGLADAERERQLEAAEKTSGVAEFWRSLPPAAQAALVSAPIGGAASGLGQYLSSRPMAGGQSKEEVLTQAAADKSQAMGEARGGHGYAGKLTEEALKGSYNVAQANREHPVQAALLAALLGGTITGGSAALLSKLR